MKHMEYCFSYGPFDIYSFGSSYFIYDEKDTCVKKVSNKKAVYDFIDTILEVDQYYR